MREYVALIHKDAGSDYGVSFPDFPGCVTAGRTLDEARAMAVDALALHIKGMLADNDAVPEPSSLEAIMHDAINRDGVAVLVNAAFATSKAIRINITLPENILHEIDDYAETHGLTRSGFLVKAAMGLIAGVDQGGNANANQEFAITQSLAMTKVLAEKEADILKNFANRLEKIAKESKDAEREALENASLETLVKAVEGKVKQTRIE